MANIKEILTVSIKQKISKTVTKNFMNSPVTLLKLITISPTIEDKVGHL